jgi:hypothetical protein
LHLGVLYTKAAKSNAVKIDAAVVTDRRFEIFGLYTGYSSTTICI